MTLSDVICKQEKLHPFKSDNSRSRNTENGNGKNLEKRNWTWDIRDSVLPQIDEPDVFEVWPEGPCKRAYSFRQSSEAVRHSSGWAMRNTNNHNVNILKKSCLGVLVCDQRCAHADSEHRHKLPVYWRPAICDKARSKQIGQPCRTPGCSGTLHLQRCQGRAGYPVTHFWRSDGKGFMFFQSKGTHNHPRPVKLCPIPGERDKIRVGNVARRSVIVKSGKGQGQGQGQGQRRKNSNKNAGKISQAIKPSTKPWTIVQPLPRIENDQHQWNMVDQKDHCFAQRSSINEQNMISQPLTHNQYYISMDSAFSGIKTELLSDIKSESSSTYSNSTWNEVRYDNINIHSPYNTNNHSFYENDSVYKQVDSMSSFVSSEDWTHRIATPIYSRTGFMTPPESESGQSPPRIFSMVPNLNESFSTRSTIDTESNTSVSEKSNVNSGHQEEFTLYNQGYYFNDSAYGMNTFSTSESNSSSNLAERFQYPYPHIRQPVKSSLYQNQSVDHHPVAFLASPSLSYESYGSQDVINYQQNSFDSRRSSFDDCTNTCVSSGTNQKLQIYPSSSLTTFGRDSQLEFDEKFIGTYTSSAISACSSNYYNNSDDFHDIWRQSAFDGMFSDNNKVYKQEGMHYTGTLDEILTDLGLPQECTMEFV